MADRYYNIQFKCKVARLGDQIRYMAYGLIKDGDLTEGDISDAKLYLIETASGGYNRIEILDFNKSEELTESEWNERLNLPNGAPK